MPLLCMCCILWLVYGGLVSDFYLPQYIPRLISVEDVRNYLSHIVTHKAVRPGARPHVSPVMAEGDFRLMTPLYDNLQ